VKIDPTLSNALCHMLDLPVDWVSRAARQLFQDTQPQFSDPSALERKEAGE
jgi:hypothetical protein